MSRDFCLVAIPAYREIPARVIASWLAQDGLDDCAWAIVEGAYLPHAMNGLTEKALQIGARRMIVLETDMVLPTGALRSMIDATEDIVGALYYRQAPPHWPLVFMEREGQDQTPGALRLYRSPTVRECLDMVEKPGLYACHALGMGCTSISREVLTGMGLEGPWWGMGGADPYSHTGAGHDVRFCQAARDLGFKVWVDSRVICGHLKDVPIGPLNFEGAQVMMAARFEGEKGPEVAMGREIPYQKRGKVVDLVTPGANPLAWMDRERDKLILPPK